jgi:hypothetical protein
MRYPSLSLTLYPQILRRNLFYFVGFFNYCGGFGVGFFSRCGARSMWLALSQSRTETHPAPSGNGVSRDLHAPGIGLHAPAGKSQGPRRRSHPRIRTLPPCGNWKGGSSLIEDPRAVPTRSPRPNPAGRKRLERSAPLRVPGRGAVGVGRPKGAPRFLDLSEHGIGTSHRAWGRSSIKTGWIFSPEVL